MYGYTIPDYQSIMLPLLQIASDKEEHSMQESIERLASLFKLSEAELRELLPIGQQEIFDNRVFYKGRNAIREKSGQ